MKQVILPFEEIEAIAATRFIFGLGTALLLGQCLADGPRRWIGWTLVAIGALSTPPLIYDVYQRRVVAER
jgi:hypothetical protein